MQIAVNHLDRPWGLDLQVGLLGGWLGSQSKNFRIHTRRFEEAHYSSLDDTVSVSSRPWSHLEVDEPTLAGPFPACCWPHRAGVKNYSLLMPDLPWDLYPKKKQKWLGRLPVYVKNNRSLLLRSLFRAMVYPWVKTRSLYRRYRDQRALANANNVFIYDDRLRKPVQDLYDRDPTLISPVAAIGGGKSTDPDQKILAVGPLDPQQNVKQLIDAFYLFVNRLGTRRREDWDGRNPMQMWQSGDFKLEIHGTGSGEEYLKDYASSQQLEDQVNFKDWIPREDYDSAIESSLAVVDIPLGGDVSTLVYHALAMGVPAIHTRHHRGIDTFLEDSDLSFKTSSTDTAEIAEALLAAAKVPSSKRVPNSTLKKALDVESGAKHLLEEVSGTET